MEQAWKDLHRAYGRSGIVLALGAGTSVGSGLPNWRGLLERVAEGTTGPRFSDLERAGLTLPAIAGVLERRFPGRESFVEAVRDGVYGDFPFYGGYEKSRIGEFTSFVRKTNASLRSVAAFSVMRTGKQTYAANPLLRSVISFNLDALFQAYVVARYRKRIVRTVERASASPRPGRVNVYHVHGFLRFDKKAKMLPYEAPDAVVLAETDYWDVIANPLGLFTYSFLYLLREYPVVFFGLSMTDDNLRRVLYFSVKEARESYMREGKSVPGEKLRRHFAILCRPRQSSVAKIFEESLAALGVNVCWIESFEEVQDRFAALYETTATARWSDVW